MPNRLTNFFFAFTAISLSILPMKSKAGPVEELTSAVHASGASNLQDATPRQFVQAFIAVGARLKSPMLPSYVAAAVEARPQLADSIVSAALRLARVGRSRQNRQLSLLLISRIITAAVGAAPDRAVAIVEAALREEPAAADAIFAAVIAVIPDFNVAALEATKNAHSIAFDASAFGTLNPANYALGPVTSPEQPPP